jgi:hypothetical protein
MESKRSQLEEKFAMIKGWQESGLSQKKYCEQHLIAYANFHYWYRRYRMVSDPLSNSGSPFIAVPVPAYSTHTELLLVDGRRLFFHQPVSVAFLKALIG